MDSGNAQPLVSVICFCKDRVSLIRRSIESVLNQTYRNIEFVVQDGASTDGTLELLRDYAGRDARVKIVSEPDSGPAEAFWKVLHRCQGEYIATCLSDEELVPDAIEKAVRWLGLARDVGAITCDGYTTDADGKIIGNFIAGEFDLVSYMFGRYCPFWPGSFFRRSALIEVGLDRPGWNLGCLEFEIWCRLATDHEVKYIAEPISKYAIHPGQLSNTPKNFHEHIDNRLALIERLFSREGFFGADEAGKVEAMINQLSQFEFHTQAHGLVEEEKAFSARIAKLKKELRRLSADAGLTLGRYGRLSADRVHRARQRISRWWKLMVSLVPLSWRQRVPLRSKLRVRALFDNVLLFSRFGHHYALWLFGVAPAAVGMSRSHAALLNRHASVAPLYEARGQIQQALDMWRRAEPLNDPVIDALACQAVLKLPAATYESIAALQQRWVDRHVTTDHEKPLHAFPRYDGQRKARIAYHCSFMDSDTIRFIMRRVIAAHDRSMFEVIGYAPMKLPEDIRSAFDIVRSTTLMESHKFIDLVHSDRIDVFVELSGFSPGHRFSEMASRLAPVQISYLNHHGTSHVPNVDYILSDAICTPLGSGAHRTFSEEIVLLPDCLLCYDYTDAVCPPVAAPPSAKTGFVTFGCFGSGGKINNTLIEWWADLLHRVPGSRLQLQNTQLSAPDNRRFMHDRFSRFGIAAERIKLYGGTTRENVLKAYDDVDISLDTWPYCGGNTVAESMWQGVPVVTYLGDRFSSRYGASLLKAAGCEDLIATNTEDYIARAAALARDPARLLFLRHNLRQFYQEHGLGNSEQFARRLEFTYAQALAKHSETSDLQRTSVPPRGAAVSS